MIWTDELPSVLWAYKTTIRTPTRETPFCLACGSEAVILAEVGIASYRTAHHDKRKNKEGICLNFDLLDEVRVVVEQQMTKVKPRHFSIRDLVLRKVITATKDPTQGKLRPNWESPYRIIDYNKKGTYYLETLDWQRLHHP